MPDVKLNFDPFKKLIKAIDRAGMAASNEPMGAMFLQWGARYLTFVRRRYKRLSAGGGEWKSLQAATGRRRKKARRSAKGKPRRHAILVETRTLFNALSIGFTGNLRERLRTPAGVRVGFTEARHNTDSITIRGLAMIHDQGLGNMPRRTILAPPDDKTVKGMLSDSRRATERLLKIIEMRGGGISG